MTKINIIITILLSFLFTSTAYSNHDIGRGIISKNTLDKKIELLKKPDKYVMVAAHRGDWRNAPENSIQAIKNCIEMGVDIVEIDVRMTKDSVLVLMHDKEIDRTTTGEGLLAEWTLDSLKTLNLRNGANHPTHHKIPTLQDAMEVAKGKILVNLDKCSEYIDKAYEVLLKTGTLNQVIFKGKKDIESVRKQYGSLLDQIIYMPMIRETTPDLDKHVNDFIAEYHPVAFEVIINTDNSQIFDVIREIKENDTRVWINTLWESLCAGHTDDRAVYDPDGAWGWVIENGGNIIQTDRPQLLIEYLRKKGLHD